MLSFKESLDVQESFKHLEFWYEENVSLITKFTLSICALIQSWFIPYKRATI